MTTGEPPRGVVVGAATKTITATCELSLFDIPFYVEGRMQQTGDETTTRFTVKVGDKSLGDVLRYIVDMVSPGKTIDLGTPWNVLDSISLNSLAFEIDFSTGQTRYGFSYSDIGLDLTFLQIEKLEIFYLPATEDKKNSSVDVNIFGTFLGIDFSKDPVSWDALKERPPSTPGAGSKTFDLEYLGLGQRVTLRNIADLTTIGQVMAELRNSYGTPKEGAADPLSTVPALTYDDTAAWLVGAQFSILETFDFAGLWNLPQLAGARIGLRGERAKSLAGFEFEILYRRIADDLGQYHLELVLPDVLRRFQAGIASVTLPIIAVDIYTDGGFLIDFGFPRDLDFSRSFSIEMIILAVPVTGAIGLYFGVLSEKAVPAIPEVTGGSFKPVIVVGVGFRIGVGKSLNAGILKAGLFIGIEGLIEGVFGFYTPLIETESKGTFYRVTGTLQLTGHIWGEVSFAIIKAKLDVYAYVAAHAVFEAYRSSLLLFEAGVSLKLTVKIGFGFFSFKVKLSFSTSIREEVTIGNDQSTPWQLASPVGTTLAERIAPVAYRRLPTGDVLADDVFAALLASQGRLPVRQVTRRAAEDRATLVLSFHPVTTLGLADDHPKKPPVDPAVGCVNLVAVLMARLSRNEGETLSPAETFVSAALQWGLEEARNHLAGFGAQLIEGDVTHSELRWLADDLVAKDPRVPIDMEAMQRFLTEFVEIELQSADSLTEDDEITPFPMIPFLSLETSSGYSTNFESEKDSICPTSYQEFITDYFERLNQNEQSDGTSSVRSMEAEDLSMAGLIFVDTFRIVLRSIVAEALNALSLLDDAAGGASLHEIAERRGVAGAAGMLRIARANTENAEFFGALSPYYIVTRGAQLAEAGSLGALASRFGLPLLTTARHVRQQPILLEGAPLLVSGGQYRIRTADTQESILERFEIPSWVDVEEANPFFDWSVPDAVSAGSPYPQLSLPAGETIRLPDVDHTVTAGDTLQDVADHFNAPLFALVSGDLTSQPVPLIPDGLAWQCISLTVQQDETLAGLAERAGFPGEDAVQQLYPTLKDNPQLLPLGARLDVPEGRYIIKRGDTLIALANTFQTTREAILAANGSEPSDDWKFIPRPGSAEDLPVGVEIKLPSVPSYRVSTETTLAAIARLFWLEHAEALATNNQDVALAPLAVVILPPLSRVMTENRLTPEDIALPFGVDPVELVLANQSAAAGQGADVALDTVLVPDAERLPEQNLLDRLGQTSGADSPSSFATTVSALARFLLAGLRLPSPIPFNEDPPKPPPITADLALYPLYALTGQQWLAPADPQESDWVELRWNDTPEAQLCLRSWVKPSLLSGDVPEPCRVLLTPLDVQLITQFRERLKDTSTLQPVLLATSPYPALEQVALEHSLGSPTAWTKPSPLSFINTPVGDEPDSQEGEQQLLMLSIPRALRQSLPSAAAPDRALEVLEGIGDPVTGQATWHELENIGWATRLQAQIRRVYATGESELPQTAAYEVLSCGAQTQADLVGLRQFIDKSGDAVQLELHVLFPSGPLSSTAGSMRSDEITPELRPQVALLKSNLSTFSRPATLMLAGAAAGEVLAAATLDQPVDFLELLWQVSVTNAGGFFLEYGVPADDAGLPDEVFDQGDSATISVLAILRVAGEQQTVAPRRFHNVLINAENLSSKESTVLVAAQRHEVVGIDPDDTAKTESLETIAAAYGTTSGELGELNASTANMIKVGRTIAYPPDDPDAPTYAVRVGDDLLTVALTLDVEVSTLAASLSVDTDLLHLGATLEVYPEWVTATNRVEQKLGGFRVLRKAPAEVVNNPEELQIQARLERLYNLLGYSLAKSADYNPSTHGLPIPPENPDPALGAGLFAMEDGETQPWVYSRLMPVAISAKSDVEPPLSFPDPYGGLTHCADFNVQFQDAFGNVLPRGSAPVSIPWDQLYRDPLIPVHSWPSVTVAYDVLHRETMHAPEVDTRIKFAPAGYASAPGTRFARLEQRARADRERYGQIYYQIFDGRVAVTMSTTLRPDYAEVVSTEELARFARDAYQYLGVLGQLAPVRYTPTGNDTLLSVSEAFQVTALDLALHNGDDPKVLLPGADIIVPLLLPVLPNTSVADIVAEFGDAKLTPQQVGTWNAKAELTPDLVLIVGDDIVITNTSSTLNKLKTDGVTPGDIATANQKVNGLFLEGEVLSLGQSHHGIQAGETLTGLAHTYELAFDILMQANTKSLFLNPERFLEIPLHLKIPEGHSWPVTVVCTVAANESLRDLKERVKGSLRDIVSANADIDALLAVTNPPQQLVYASPSGEQLIESVVASDTYSTVTQRFSQRLQDPSLKPADVGAYPANAKNETLLATDASVLLPPRRTVISLSVPKDATRDIIVEPLRVELTIQRPDNDTIAPNFSKSAEVKSVSSTVAPRLSSNFSPEERATLVAFTRQFQKVFAHLKIATGPDTITSDQAALAETGTQDTPTRLMVVQWDRKVLDATVRGPACFFAPKPLLTEMWHAKNVPIYSYESGKPLVPPDLAADPTLTNFAGVDIERWAESLLRRVDALFLPDMAIPLRALSPEQYQSLVQIKQQLAEAIAERIALVLPADCPNAPLPDPVSAKEQYLQQILVQLGETYRGGIVVQYEADVVAPKPEDAHSPMWDWTPGQAPRLLCNMEPSRTAIPVDDPTLDGLAQLYDAPALLIATILAKTENLLAVGQKIPFGLKPTIQEQDTFDSIASNTGVSLEILVSKMKARTDFLAADASVSLVGRTFSCDRDDTFASMLEHLAPNLTSRGLLDEAIGILDALSGEEPGVFVPGQKLTHVIGGKTQTHTTAATDTIRSVATALKYDQVSDFIHSEYVASPLLAEDAKFRYLTLYPPSTISAAKIALYAGGEPASKLNAIYITSAPDEASSVKLKLGYKVQALEYNVHDIAAAYDEPDVTAGYQASDWLTFVDWDHGEDLGDIEIPIPNRRFPVPPAVLSHDTLPHLADGEVDPDKLEQVPYYDYVLSFAFDAAAQDDLFYTPTYNEVPPGAAAADDNTEDLAMALAQFAAIDEALWRDLSKLQSIDEQPPSNEGSHDVLNAVQVFTKLGQEIASAWSTWQPKLVTTAGTTRYRIRRHRHPDGRAQVTVCPTTKATDPSELVQRPTPSARLLGHQASEHSFAGVSHTSMESPLPIPRTRYGEQYEVRDPDLTVLSEQNVWGRISVTRNERLIQGCDTEPAFVMHIRDVRAIQPAIPMITITQKLSVASGLGLLDERLEQLLKLLLFPSTGEPTAATQLASLSAAFSRPLVEPKAATLQGDPVPADSKTLFAPVVITPALLLAKSGVGEAVACSAVSAEMAAYLDEWLHERKLAPSEHWAFALRLFSTLGGQASQSPLLELLDLRVRMADE